MNVYIATKFENKKGFHAAKKLLEAAGHTVNCDWTKHDATTIPLAALPGYLNVCALECSRGVCEAEAVILLAYPKIAGALVELGLAIGLEKHVIIVDPFGKKNQPNIFYHLPKIRGIFEHAESVEDAIELLSPVVALPVGDPSNN